MTERDIRAIERELGVALPPCLTRRVAPYLVPALRGNSDSELWDDAEALIARNRSLQLSVALSESAPRGGMT